MQILYNMKPVFRDTKELAAKYAVAKFGSLQSWPKHYGSRVEAIGRFFNAYLYLSGKQVDDNR